ncbi:MAG: hypothetical protein DDT21_01871 [Syntrophomonadaceae bacterium]|nr:hypothetical protein [Bacillota bacterium]
MSNHTPGPWHVENDLQYDGGTIPYIVSETDVWIAKTNTFSTNVEANARLIAAAPELLEALKKLLALEMRYTNVGLKEFDAARAAIKKVERKTIRDYVKHAALRESI